MKAHWQGDTLFGVASLVSVWLAVFAYSCAEGIYNDHQKLVALAKHASDDMQAAQKAVAASDARSIGLQRELDAERDKPPRITQQVQAPPAKDRTAIVKELQARYVAGGVLFSALAREVTDQQIDQLAISADQWFSGAHNWIRKNMGDVAASRFEDNSDKTSHSYDLKGEHSAETREKRNRYLDAIAGCRINLQTLMQSAHTAPDRTSTSSTRTACAAPSAGQRALRTTPSTRPTSAGCIPTGSARVAHRKLPTSSRRRCAASHVIKKWTSTQQAMTRRGPRGS